MEQLSAVELIKRKRRQAKLSALTDRKEEANRRNLLLSAKGDQPLPVKLHGDVNAEDGASEGRDDPSTVEGHSPHVDVAVETDIPSAEDTDLVQRRSGSKRLQGASAEEPVAKRAAVGSSEPQAPPTLTIQTVKNYEDAVELARRMVANVPPLRGIPLQTREGALVRLGRAPIHRAYDQKAYEKLVRDKPSKEHLLCRKGLLVSEFATISAYENDLAKAADKQLYEVKAAQKKGEIDRAALAELLKAKEAALEAAQAKVEAEVARAEEERVKAEEHRRLKDAELAEERRLKAEVQVRAEEAEAECRGLEATLPSREEEAVVRFKASRAFQDAVDEKTATMFEDGYLHLARRLLADPSLGLDVNTIARLICKGQFDEEARALHHLVPFFEYNLGIMAKEDAQASREAWVPPSVNPGNLKVVIEMIEDEEMDAEAEGGAAEEAHTNVQAEQTTSPANDAATEEFLEKPFDDAQQA